MKIFVKAIIASLNPPNVNYVNDTKKEAFRSAGFVMQGEENLRNLDMDALTNYGIELQSYEGLIY
jgi:hypothetical protein